MGEKTCEIWQDGICVASVSSDDEEALTREMFHYARQYMQDGPITIKNATPMMMGIFRSLMANGEHQPLSPDKGKES